MEEDDSTSTSTSEEEMELEVSEVSLEECALTYFAGYLGGKVNTKFQCNKCQAKLTTDEPITGENYEYILNKDFNLHMSDTSTLVSPSKFAVDIVRYIMKATLTILKKSPKRRDIKKSILSKTKKYFNYFPVEDASCESHMTFFINHAINVTLFKNCKFLSEKFSSEKSKSSKLNILKNN